jgi:hypothetical protein
MNNSNINNNNTNEFQQYCIELLKKIELPIITMHNDLEAVLVYFYNSEHIEFIIKHTILKLGKKWSFTIVCGYSNYNFIYSICSVLSENIKIIKIANPLSIGDESFWKLFHGEKLFFYDEHTLIVNETICNFLQWDYISNTNIDHNTLTISFDNLNVAIVSKKYANKLSDPSCRIADVESNHEFISYNTNQKNPTCFCYYKPIINKQKLPTLTYSANGLYNPTHYKILNIDLQDLNKTELLNHFRNFGYHEKKQCYIKNRDMHQYIHEYCDFDSQFVSSHYLFYHPELAHLNSIELLKHYNTIGKRNGETGFIENTNHNFNPIHYIKMYPSLKGLNGKDLYQHYLHNKDRRNLIDDVKNVKKVGIDTCIVFINSTSELCDETVFLYDYVLYLQELRLYDKIIVLDVYFNEDLFHYYDQLTIKPIFYCNHYILLRELVEFYDPLFIYSNGLNYLTLNISKFSQNIVNKTVFHFHTSIEAIPTTVKQLHDNIIYCSNEKIKEQFIHSFGLDHVQLFNFFIRKQEISNQPSFDLFGNDNILFGMFGNTTYENGFDIFKKIVKNMPEYNFIWIGGDHDPSFSADNFIHISTCLDVYKYIDYIDYLLVTVRNRSPFVILQALYKNCPCIVLENKMTTDIAVGGFYKILHHNNDTTKIVSFLKTDIVLMKKKNQGLSISNRIYNHFSKPIIKYEFVKAQSAISHKKNKPINSTVAMQSNPYFYWIHYLLKNPDLIDNNILTYQQALDHWNHYGVKENRYAIIPYSELEQYTTIYNGLKQKISENWYDYSLETIIQMKIKGNTTCQIHKFLFDHFSYKTIPSPYIKKIISAISKSIFHDNDKELSCFPKKDGHIDLSPYGIFIDELDIEYFYKQYKKCWYSFSSLEDAVCFWNLFGKNNNYIRSPEQELYEDVHFDWLYYKGANRLDYKIVSSKETAFLHWNKYGKKGGLIGSNISIKKEYNRVTKTNYDFLSAIPDNHYPEFKNTLISKIVDVSTSPNTLSYEKTFNQPLFPGLTVIHTIDDLSPFIFVIDFPNYGGGCGLFLHSIITAYKTKQPFLIARQFSTGIHFYVNDEFMLEKVYTVDEAITFITNLRNRMNKIFINSIIGHKKPFLDSLFTLGLEVSAITHDYSLLYDFAQGYYHEIMNHTMTCSFPIEKCNQVITQHKQNIALFGSKINGRKFIIAQLPDHRNPLKRIENGQNDLVIGLLGNISNLKGYYIIEQLVLFAKKQNQKNKNKDRNKQYIRIVLFGNIPYFDKDGDFIEKYPYKNIEELNKLLTEHKPHLWIETSLWPETYSYTLTLMMITELPIFYQQKNFPSVIRSRLSEYRNSYSFPTIDWLTENWNKVSEKKQDYFYTIDPAIHYNFFWEYYFGNQPTLSRPLQNFVFISSKIIVSTNRFNYSDSRSIYTSEERYDQTLQTIESIRCHIPNSYIILFDNSDFSQDQYSTLHEKTDLFLNITTDLDIYDYTNNKAYKLYGELAQTAYVLQYIKDHRLAIHMNHFFKISGRYWINDSFCFDTYVNESNIFKRKEDITNRKYYYTSFYKISGTQFASFTDTILSMYEESKDSDIYDGYDWEVLLSKKLEYNFTEVDNLGITENIAVWKQQTLI